MTRSLILTTTLGAVNFEDGISYFVPRDTEQETIEYQTVSNPIRNTAQINLGMHKAISRTLSFELLVKGTGWADILSKITAIQSHLDAAASYSLAATGSQATIAELQGNQVTATTYYVVYGKLVENRKLRLTPRNYTFVHVDLVCEPGAH